MALKVLLAVVDFAIFDEPIGIELLSYHPNDNRLDTVTVEMGSLTKIG